MQPPDVPANNADRSGKLLELQKLLTQKRWTRAASPSAPATWWQRLVGGVGPARLVDCLTVAGCGGGLVALHFCKQACLKSGELVVVDPGGTFFPPAAVAWGIDAKRLLVVNPASGADALALVETSLRSPAVGAVWASLGAIDDRTFRRLLLATEAGRAFGALVRPARHEPHPSWGDVQLRFAAGHAARADDPLFRVRVTQTRNRHGPAGEEAQLAIDWKNGVIEELLPEDHAQQPPQNALHPAAGLARAARSA